MLRPTASPISNPPTITEATMEPSEPLRPTPAPTIVSSAAPSYFLEGSDYAPAYILVYPPPQSSEDSLLSTEAAATARYHEGNTR